MIYRIFWINPDKQRQEVSEFEDQTIALFVAKKKVNEGMQNVVIQLFPGSQTIPDDAIPVVDAKIEEENN